MSKEGKQMNHLLKKGTVLFAPAGLLALSVTSAAAQTATPAADDGAATGGWLGWPWWVWILLGLLLVVLLWWLLGRRRPAAPPPPPPAARRVVTPAAPPAPLVPPGPAAQLDVPMTPAAVFEPEPLPELDIPEPPVRVVEPELAAMAPDNLKRIEGIGPRIESLLNSAGITTFQQLSDTPVDRLREIMVAAELRGSFGDPTTWPEQARLAAAGLWDELKMLQDGLKGGHQN